MSADFRNQDLICARRRPKCGHRRREHAPDACMGVTLVCGVAGDCHCKIFIPPGDIEPKGRQQEPP